MHTRVGTLVTLIAVSTCLFIWKKYSIQHGLIRDHMPIGILQKKVGNIHFYKICTSNAFETQLFSSVFCIIRIRFDWRYLQNNIWLHLVYKSAQIKDRKFPPNMLIQDHMVISFFVVVHPTCLYGTTWQLGPLEY